MGKQIFSAIGRVIKWIVGQSQVERLLLAATVVAGLRLMLIHAVFIGFGLDAWPWFKPVEVMSGLAFAVLEGKALAYVSRLWVRLKPANWTDWLYWSLLAAGQALLLGSIIGVTAFAAASVRRDTGIDELLGNGEAVAWSMFVTALNPLMVILIGIARAIDTDEKGEEIDSITIRKGDRTTKGPISVEELAGIYAQRIREVNSEVTPDQFIVAFEEAQGFTLTTQEAEAALLAAQPGPAKRSKNGHKPS